jgi:ABC-type oligopeptide transport system substrate-binding subunit
VLFHGDSPINFFGWRDTRFDRLVDQAATLTDQQDRMALYHEADRILVAEAAAAAPLFYYRAFGVLRRPFVIAGGRKILRGGMFKLKDIVVTG